MGSHEQVGCEKPSTLSGRQRTALVVAVGRIVCVCVCVCVSVQAFTTFTMWVYGHSSFWGENSDPTLKCWSAENSVTKIKMILCKCKTLKRGLSTCIHNVNVVPCYALDD